MFKGQEPHARERATTSTSCWSAPAPNWHNATTFLDRTNHYENLGQRTPGHRGWAWRPTACATCCCARKTANPEMTVVRNEFEAWRTPHPGAVQGDLPVSLCGPPLPPTARSGTAAISRRCRLPSCASSTTPLLANNATVTIIGDFEPAQALELVKVFRRLSTFHPNPFRRCTPKRPSRPVHDGHRQASQSAGRGCGGAQGPGRPRMPIFAAVQLMSAILTDGKNSMYKAITNKNLSTGVGRLGDLPRSQPAHGVYRWPPPAA